MLCSYYPLTRDPADNSEWACVRKLRVSPLPRPQGDSARLLPAPCQVFDFNSTHTQTKGAQDFMWIPIDRIIDSIGIVTTHGERREWNGQRHWIVDKEGLSESPDYIQSLLSLVQDVCKSRVSSHHIDKRKTRMQLPDAIHQQAHLVPLLSLRSRTQSH